MKAEALKRIIDEYAGDPKGLPDFLSGALREIGEIKRRLFCQELRRKGFEEDYRKALASVGSEIASIRSDWRHWSTTYYADASGGSDSSTICDICGAELTKSGGLAK